MGMFLSMTSVIGKTKNEVVTSLADYAKSAYGGLEKENLPIDDDNCCVIEEADGNTTIFYPYAYLGWDKSSEFISKSLNAPVFSFHIHDGDLWMYVLFVNGVTVDQFNPIPDYWEDNLDEGEIQNWKGNAATIAQYVKSVQKENVEKYLVRWNLEEEGTEKAYLDDEFTQEDWQLLDFMKKLGLPYPLNNEGKPKGDTFKLWTKDLPLQEQVSKNNNGTIGFSNTTLKKPWWKLW